MAPIDAAERARLLAELAAQQAGQREQHVTELAGLHDRVRAARTELAAAEAAYRAAWRRAITTGLLTAGQLRGLGLPPPDAHRRTRHRVVTAAPGESSTLHDTADQPAAGD